MRYFTILNLVLAGFSCEARGDSAVDPVDASTLQSKVMCGYQGWFNCAGDGSGLQWVHWARDRQRPPGPGNVTVDLWPDLSEYAANERYATDFRLADGSVAEVFSSHNRATVMRHFRWMQEYGIDGAFVQRFMNNAQDSALRAHKDQVLAHARDGAAEYGRAYAVMYDLSGLRAGEVQKVGKDWKALRARLEMTDDQQYLKHRGKPLVAVWGIGFGGEDRDYTLEETRKLIEFLKNDGCSVMLGVPSFFREQKRDATDDPALHGVLALADVLSPWTIGRYETPAQAKNHAATVISPDLAWCAERELDYLPVVFPGFSWNNLHGGGVGKIPRLGGQFLWTQMVEAQKAGAGMIYVAMFDEVDEGTAIFKCTNQVPVGDDFEFLTLKGLPSDHYLKLTGAGGRMLRGEIPASESMPPLQ